MRISDWSSDVCSSDLAALDRLDLRVLAIVQFELPVEERVKLGFDRRLQRDISASDEDPCDRRREGDQRDRQQAETVVHWPQPSKAEGASAEIGRASGRERWGQYVSISVVAVSL